MRKSDARKLVMARWSAYLAHVSRTYVLPTIAYVKQMAARADLSPAQLAQVRDMIPILEETARLFSSPLTYRMVPRIERLNQCFALSLITLSAWDGDDIALKHWADEILGSPKQWRHLAEIATLPMLKHNRNWTTAERPVPYMAKAARYRMIDEFERALPREEEVPLDEAPELRAPDPAPIVDPLDDLIAAVLTGADPDVKAFGELVLRGCTHDEARRQLGWYQKRAHKVAVRYRRRLKVAARDSDLQTLRQAVRSWQTNASSTIVMRTFRDDQAGQQRGYYEHLDDWKARLKS